MPGKRWTSAPYLPVGGKLQKALLCSVCKGNLFTIYEQKPLRRGGTTKRVGTYAKCTNLNCGRVTRIVAGYPR
jgi:hypothetical protein